MWSQSAIVTFTLLAAALSPATSHPERPAPPLVAQQAPKTAPTSAGPKSAGPMSPGKADLKHVVAAMQQAYEGTKDFQATFTQRYTYTLLRRTQESRGKVRFKKPGLMRWDYDAPTPKSFVVDGKALWVHQPQDHMAMVDHCFKQDGLTASVAFLWGAGDIAEQFQVAWFDGVFGDKADLHLELVPKKANSVFAKLILVIDPESYRVKQSMVVDLQGNVNQFIYGDLQFNGGVQEAAFRFEPPKGTNVSRMPGSCDPTAQGK